MNQITLKKIVVLAPLYTLLECLLLAVLFFFTASLAEGLYLALMSFFNLLLPTAIGVVVFYGIVIRFSPRLLWLKISGQIVFLSGMFLLGLFFWAYSEQLIYYQALVFDWPKIYATFQTDFVGYLPCAAALALLLPLLEVYLQNKNLLRA